MKFLGDRLSKTRQNILNNSIEFYLKYELESHKSRLRAEAEYRPCRLCGEIHRLRIHAAVRRKIRADEEENTDILIISIYCIRAKKKGGNTPNGYSRLL